VYDITAHSRTFSLRLPDKLATDLKRAATEESNTPSAVARRLIAAGLKRELRPEPPSGDEAA
jgi:predicted transcriptional regulator